MSLSSLSSLSEEEFPSTTVTSTISYQPLYKRRRTYGTYTERDDKLEILNKYDDDEFKRKFGFTKETVLYLCSLIEGNIQPPTKRNKAIQAIDQVLITLRYLGTGSHQKVVGETFNREQTTVHRIIHRVCVELAKLKGMFINMPTCDEQDQISRDFCEIAEFPNVVGAIGCTHVKIKCPGGMQANTHKNYKGNYSVKVQVVCDTQLQIRDIIADSPGSLHESIIFNESPLYAQMEMDNDSYDNKVLLGDNCYPCQQCLLTPVRNPVTSTEQAYNIAHVQTRSTIRRLFGILKRTFPCLHVGLQIKLPNVPDIIVACAVIHNIAISRQDVNEEYNDELLKFDAPPPAPEWENEDFSMRDLIINTYFTN